MADKYVYPYTADDARNRNELALWRESHKLNIACKKAVEDAIRRDFDGMYLKDGCAQSVIDEYGFKRLNLVLATTVREKTWDGRFSHGNKLWAQTAVIPMDKEKLGSYVVESHPAVLDGFINSVRKAYDALQLFDVSHCLPDDGEQDYEGKVIVLSTRTLKEDFWSNENQLWLCTGGFGSHPHARGRAVFATCLGDGEQTRWDRSDFIGVLKDEFLPDWAKEKLEELQAPQGPTLGGQTM
jgi:hypothetical protein